MVPIDTSEEKTGDLIVLLRQRAARLSIADEQFLHQVLAEYSEDWAWRLARELSIPPAGSKAPPARAHGSPAVSDGPCALREAFLVEDCGDHVSPAL